MPTEPLVTHSLLDDLSTSYINGQRATCELDGVAVSCQRLLATSGDALAVGDGTIPVAKVAGQFWVPQVKRQFNRNWETPSDMWVNNISGWQVIDVSTYQRQAGQQGRERMDEDSKNLLKSQLKKLQDDELCGKFLKAVISQINDKVFTSHPPFTLTKFDGDLVGNFDRIDGSGGIWIDDIPASRKAEAIYNASNDSITYERSLFNPNDSREVYYYFEDKKSKFGGVTTPYKQNIVYKTTKNFRVILGITHELIHGYYNNFSDAVHKRNVTHVEMNTFALKALKEMGIKPHNDDIDEVGETFNDALLQACSHVKL